jgi:osmotically-inducible protein OsmY
MKSDSQLRSDIEAELDWDPAIRAGDIGVIVKDAIVTLTGHVANYAEKHAAERAVRRVKGVKAVAMETKVKLPGGLERSDTDIAAAAERSLEWNVLVPDGKIEPVVENGWITLTGEVEWQYQSRAADAAVRNLLGVTGVTNLIKVTPRLNPVDIEKRIHDALVRQADNDTRKVHIGVAGSAVELSGKVQSWSERNAIQLAAWSAPGVSSVANHLLVES